MASEKAIYWVAVGVLALMVGDHFASKVDSSCLRDAAVVSIQRLSTDASNSLALVEAALGRTSMPWVNAETSAARMQTRLASVQTMIARQESACARMEGRHARLMAMQEMRNAEMRVNSPRLQVVIPQIEIPQIQIPQIQVPETRVVVSDDEI